MMGPHDASFLSISFPASPSLRTDIQGSCLQASPCTSPPFDELLAVFLPILARMGPSVRPGPGGSYPHPGMMRMVLGWGWYWLEPALDLNLSGGGEASQPPPRPGRG